LKDEGLGNVSMMQVCMMHSEDERDGKIHIIIIIIIIKSKTSINDHDNNEIWCAVFTCCYTMLALDVVVN